MVRYQKVKGKFKPKLLTDKAGEGIQTLAACSEALTKWIPSYLVLSQEL